MAQDLYKEITLRPKKQPKPPVAQKAYRGFSTVNEENSSFQMYDLNLIKQDLEEFIVFQVENIKILLIHIAGKPPYYNKKTLKLIKKYKPKILICGHSHILKIMKDDVNNILVINPGALGKIGFHKKKTMVRIDIDRSKISNVEVIKF